MTQAIESLLERYPSLGWLSSVFSFFTGLFSWVVAHADTITKLLGMVAAALGVWVGILTVRIHRRTLARSESKPPFEDKK